LKVIDLLTDSTVLSMLFLLASMIWMAMDDPTDKPRTVLFLAMVANLFYGSVLNKTMAARDSLLPWKGDRCLYRIDIALGLPYLALVRAVGGSTAVQRIWPSFISRSRWS
jgi:hypothetical protein